MKMSVDIYQCDTKQILVIVHGEAEGMAAFLDYDSFAEFVEACQEFIAKRTKIPDVFLDAFKDEDNLLQ